MTLSDVRDFIESLGVTDNVYQGKMTDKEDKSIGVYNSKHSYPYKTALGGASCESYGVKYMTFLVHWNKSPQDTENASNSLFGKLLEARDEVVNNKTIKFIQPLVDGPVPIDTDENGIFEMVIEAAVIYAKGE